MILQGFRRVGTTGAHRLMGPKIEPRFAGSWHLGTGLCRGDCSSLGVRVCSLWCLGPVNVP